MKNVEKNEYAMNEILNSRVNKKKKNSIIDTKNCLQYQIK